MNFRACSYSANIFGYMAHGKMGSRNPHLGGIPTLAQLRDPPAEGVDLVPLGIHATREFRMGLKIYAATIGKSMQDVVLEGIEMHREKHGRR